MAGKKNPVGTPRTVSPPPNELKKLGQEMIQWIKKNDPLHISEWYSTHKFFTENAWKTMIVRSEFVGYYEQAKLLIGKKYLDRTSNVREGASQRWQRVYFKDLREEEDATKRFEIEVKSEADLKNQIPPNIDSINRDHENMLLKDEIKCLRDQLKTFVENANKS